MRNTLAANAFHEGYLPVSPLHRIRYRQYGNPKGVPLVLLHGGPGAGINEREVRAYDLASHRVVAFDQRGSGKSEPNGELRENTTQDLIEDVEKLRRHLDIGDFILAGGSWGTTLALLYAESYPKNVKGLVLRATYLGRQEDLDWLYGTDGVRTIYPERWLEFVGCIPEDQRGDVIAAYDKLLNCADLQIRIDAASTWNEWPPASAEPSAARLVFKDDGQRDQVLNYCLVGIHYWKNGLFLQEGEVLENLAKITHVPIEMVHGAQDMVVRPQGAMEIKKAHPDAALTLVEGAGHSIHEPEIFTALGQAARRLRMKSRLRS